MNECTRCRNDWHEACTGASWTDDLKPAVCSCWALHGHHIKTAKKASRV